MRTSVRYFRRELLTPWLVCALLPLPALVIWHSTSDSGGALGLFFVGCTSFTAFAFRSALDSAQEERSWRDQMLPIGIGLLSAWIVFCLVSFIVHGKDDLAAPFVAFQILIPSFCVTPYLLLVTRKLVATVVFTLFLVGCMKMLAGIVVNLVYGWRDGHHELPWLAPNLMLSAFWINTLVLCISFYFLGTRSFRHDVFQTEQQ